MKRLFSLFCIATFLFLATPIHVGYAADNVIDQAGDWFATLGKQGMEKDTIIAQRKAERAAKQAEAEAKKAAKEAEKAGSDMKKKMGF